MSYDLRNDQEASVVARRSAREVLTAPPPGEEADDENACPILRSDAIRWMCLAGLAFLGLGVGLQLGMDQLGNGNRRSPQNPTA